MEEQFDILHPDGSFAGYSLPRSQAHREGHWHRSVHIWIVDEWDRLLLQQRALDKDSNPGLWDISSAGHISGGQQSRDAAVREVSEELGLEIAPERLEFLFVDQDECVLNGGRFIDREFHDIYWLHLKPGESRLINPDPVELAGVRWISPEVFAQELRDMPQDFVSHPHEYPKILALFQ